MAPMSLLTNNLNMVGIKTMANQKIPELFLNRKFGRLLVKKSMGMNKYGISLWLCECECGRKKIVRGGNLKSGKTRSCGCLARETTIKRNRVHGMTNTPEYDAFNHMICRCENSNDKSYKDYGGRGVFVSDEFHDFKTWYDYIGPRPGLGYSQDRIDNEGNYERGNIHWTTTKEQNNNQRDRKDQCWFLAYNENTGEWDEDNNQMEFSRKHNISHGGISDCLRNVKKIHKGWIFQWL